MFHFLMRNVILNKKLANKQIFTMYSYSHINIHVLPYSMSDPAISVTSVTTNSQIYVCAVMFLPNEQN
jgi:hypothetical protein